MSNVVPLREYEFTFIVRSDLPEADRNECIAKYEKTLLGEQGVVLRKQDWGVKKLAFPMKKSFRGQYLHYDLASVPANLAEVQRLMRIDDNILRFLAIKTADAVTDLDKRKDELEKEAIATQERASYREE